MLLIFKMFSTEVFSKCYNFSMLRRSKYYSTSGTFQCYKFIPQSIFLHSFHTFFSYLYDAVTKSKKFLFKAISVRELF